MQNWLFLSSKTWSCTDSCDPRNSCDKWDSCPYTNKREDCSGADKRDLRTDEWDSLYTDKQTSTCKINTTVFKLANANQQFWIIALRIMRKRVVVHANVLIVVSSLIFPVKESIHHQICHLTWRICTPIARLLWIKKKHYKFTSCSVNLQICSQKDMVILEGQTWWSTE